MATGLLNYVGAKRNSNRGMSINTLNVRLMEFIALLAVVAKICDEMKRK